MFLSVLKIFSSLTTMMPVGYIQYVILYLIDHRVSGVLLAMTYTNNLMTGSGHERGVSNVQQPAPVFHLKGRQLIIYGL